MKSIVSFARLLREAGLPVAPSEISDAVNCLAVLELEGPNYLHRAVLQSSLIKRTEDILVFDIIYDIFFKGTASENLTATERLGQAKGEQALKSSGLPTLAHSMLTGDFTPNLKVLQVYLEKSCPPLPIDERVRRALVNLDYFGALNTLRLDREKGKLSEFEYQTALSNGAAFTHEVRKAVLARLLESGSDWTGIAEHLNWRQKSFQLLTPAEMNLVNQYLDKIGKKLATRLGNKYKRAFSGKLDLGCTVRKAMAAGGNVWNLAYVKKVPLKPDWILLCDVSNSVYSFTGFMLQLVAAFSAKFRRVRIFVFVDNLWEVPTEQLGKDPAALLREIKESNRCSISGLSDFGMVFSQFAALGDTSSETTLIILGDGRNNWRPPELPAFKQICRQMHKVFWLNPFLKTEWGKEDCLMHLYGPHCTSVFECGNLAQLEQVTKKIF